MKYAGYVYITENIVNGKKYIGKRQKSKFDASYKGSGRRLKEDIKKFGKSNFETFILEWCETPEKLLEQERKWIAMAGAQERDDFYNICEGGQFGDISKGLSPEEYEIWLNHLSIAITGRKHSEETKRKISESHMGKTYSDETIEKMRANNTGSGNPMYGKKHSVKTKEMMSLNSKCKKSVAISVSGEEKTFDKVTDCYEYLEKKYNLSRGTTKKLLRTNKPFNSHYSKFKHINGLRVFYVESWENTRN